MPSGFSIGPLTIHYYGVLIMLGVVFAAFIADRNAKQRGLDSELIWDMLPWLLIGGIAGARIWHILTPPPSMIAQGITAQYYLTHPLDALAIWRGGLGIPGAVIGGLIALAIYARKHHMYIPTWVDIIAPGLALAQAIGRWGNFVNQELYGSPSNLPWAIYIDPQHRLPEYQDIAYYHPTFLYESLWNIANMGILLWLSKRYSKWLKPGDIFLVYLVIYPVGRFLVEMLRLDSSRVGGINFNQTLMAVTAVCATAALIIRHHTGTRQEDMVAAEEMEKTAQLEDEPGGSSVNEMPGQE
jgi:phosphatidylglycerol---prolipoprotein diacylglyceryl transferase